MTSILAYSEIWEEKIREKIEMKVSFVMKKEKEMILKEEKRKTDFWKGEFGENRFGTRIGNKEFNTHFEKKKNSFCFFFFDEFFFFLKLNREERRKKIWSLENKINGN